MASLSSHFPLSMALLAALFIPTISRGVLPENHVALFIFGDSVFDVGNNNYLGKDVPHVNFPPYGETFLPNPTGRACDGRLVPDFIAERANLPLIPPYLQPDFHNYIDGVNFASGGAGILNQTNLTSTWHVGGEHHIQPSEFETVHQSTANWPYGTVRDVPH